MLSKISFVFTFIFVLFGSSFPLVSGDSSSALCIQRLSSFIFLPSSNWENFGVAIFCLKSFCAFSVT
ncbi:unnamed protein product [Meloidogyne enterolobii]|uniref:Uncharacterized protein n=1 Tax=Meloidogyne enterolobii TaxID=390850 RepID=A0ACB0Y9Y5_MELEN